jgi:hypothetical protein
MNNTDNATSTAAVNERISLFGLGACLLGSLALLTSQLVAYTTLLG